MLGLLLWMAVPLGIALTAWLWVQLTPRPRPDHHLRCDCMECGRWYAEQALRRKR